MALVFPEKGTSQDKTIKVDKPDIAWRDLNYKAGSKAILTDCWGKVRSGEVCAIMGPSGAGKSSLLNVLAGRSAPGAGLTINGVVTVGGKTINPVTFRKNIAYVMQDDALLATATPREAMLFSARMRLPATYSSEKIAGLVDRLLEELGLAVCADVMIGGAMIKGISGGQRKRTSVGVELVTDPSVLFLDEPTTGLDSYSACALVGLLKAVAQRDCTVLCTIHQPSSEVFFLFDTVVFMKDGRVFYQGPCRQATAHFGKLGYPCPHSYNPSDFIMSLCQTIPESEATAKHMFQEAPEEVRAIGQSRSSTRLDAEAQFAVERSFARQVLALTHREFVNTYRDVGALIGRFGVTAFLNLLFGLIFLGAASKDNGDAHDFNSHFGSISMVTISMMFGSAQPTMLAFPYERPMFMREYATGTYGAVAYFLSKVIVELPLTFVQTLVANLLTYFMIGMRGQFIQFVAVGWGLALASSSVALMLGCALGDVKKVQEMAPLMFVPQMLFMGFFVKTSHIPVFLRWAQYLCSLKYAMNLIILVEFHLGLDSCQTSDAARDNCHGIMVSNNVDKDQFYVYILVLAALVVAFRLLGGVLLVQKAKKFY